jgi:hypothetical protein
MYAEQASAGSVIHTPTTIYNFSDSVYLANNVLSWPSCPSDSIPTQMQWDNVNLETLAVSRNVTTTPNYIAPLADVTQGPSNMCSSLAFCQAYSIKYALQSSGVRIPQLSAVYAYYFQRIEECTRTGVCPCTACQSPCENKCDPPCIDCGSYLQSAVSIFMVGVSDSFSWPNSTPMNTPPSEDARKNAASHKLTAYECIPVNDNVVDNVYGNLMQENLVVIFMNLTRDTQNWMESMIAWASDDLGTTKMPRKEGTTTVCHIAVVIGYDKSLDAFIVRNSFGFQWGSNGRFIIGKSDFTLDLITNAVSIKAVI